MEGSPGVAAVESAPASGRLPASPAASAPPAAAVVLRKVLRLASMVRVSVVVVRRYKSRLRVLMNAVMRKMAP